MLQRALPSWYLCHGLLVCASLVITASALLLVLYLLASAATFLAHLKLHMTLSISAASSFLILKLAVFHQKAWMQVMPGASAVVVITTQISVTLTDADLFIVVVGNNPSVSKGYGIVTGKHNWHCA